MPGCSVPLDQSILSDSFISQKWLHFIEDRKSTKDDVIEALGQPTESYAEGKVLAYRLILIDRNHELTEKEYRNILTMIQNERRNKSWTITNNRRKILAEKGGLIVIRDDTEESMAMHLVIREAEYSLILAFNDQNLLDSHSLLRILP